VSTSPRRAKRFLNVYLVIRARALGDPVMRWQLDSDDNFPPSTHGEALLVLVALLMGLPKTMAQSIHERRATDADYVMTLGKWLTKISQSTPDEQGRLKKFLSTKPSVMHLRMDAVMQWLTLVRPYFPFGFEEIRTSDPAGTSTHNKSEQS